MYNSLTISNFALIYLIFMQGNKQYEEQLFLSFRLSERVPKENFYRRLKESLDLFYLRKMTAHYYGTEGQKSIDAEVFFKLMLIGYLFAKNIIVNQGLLRKYFSIIKLTTAVLM